MDEYDDEGSLLDQLTEQAEQELLEAQRQQAEMQEQRAIEERLLKNMLKQVLREVGVSGATKLKSVPTGRRRKSQKQIVRESKAFPNLRQDITKINLMLDANKPKKASKFMSASPILFSIGMGALILVLIVCVFSVVGSIMPWLFPGDEGGGANAVYGITGDDFYGARMVYKDDEKATKSILKDFVELVENGITAVEEINTVTTSDSTTFNVTLDVTITIPADDFDYASEQFALDYSALYNIVYDVAKFVYKTDNNADFAGTSLVECVGGIKYFGIGITDDKRAEFLTMISSGMFGENYSNISITAVKDGTIVSDSATLGQIQTAVQSEVGNKLSTLYSDEKYSVRTEKLFVKDYILTADDAMLSGIAKENYVAMIFMAKNDVTFTKLSFAVGCGDLSDFIIGITNDGQSISISSDGQNLGTQENQSYIFSTATVNVSTGVFSAIDVNNLNALTIEMSLFDVVENLDESIYLETSTYENANSYLTFKKTGVVVNMANDEEFNFVEYETAWETAS